MVHRCVLNLVVMWLYILVGPCWCVYVALFGSRLIPNSATYTHTYTMFLSSKMTFGFAEM
jgi:hypothetical protein